jgi:hypothetical protein
MPGAAGVKAMRHVERIFDACGNLASLFLCQCALDDAAGAVLAGIVREREGLVHLGLRGSQFSSAAGGGAWDELRAAVAENPQVTVAALALPQRVAFAMGAHPRLGARSEVARLPGDVVRRIVTMLRARGAGWRPGRLRRSNPWRLPTRPTLCCWRGEPGWQGRVDVFFSTKLVQ